METTHASTHHLVIAPRRSMRKTVETILWYVVLCMIAALTIFPFLWVFFTSFKGPSDPIVSVPPQLFPHDPTLENYIRVWNQLPIAFFFLNSIIVSLATVVLNLLFTSLAAYPLAKMNFKGRDLISSCSWPPSSCPRAHLHPQLHSGGQGDKTTTASSR